MILWMVLGVCLASLGGTLLAGAYRSITNPDMARVMDIEMTKGLLIFVVVVSTLFIYGGYTMFSVNLLAAASVLQ